MQELRGKTFKKIPPHSCRDTITGECLTGVTADECSKICEKSDLCEVAAFSGGECRPFYTEIYDYVNPLDMLQNSDDPEDVVFVNKKAWNFPSDTAGIVNTRDSFYFTTADDRTIATESAGKPLKISESGFVKTQLIFQDIHGPNGRVEICDSVLINRPGTNLILRGDGRKLVWEPALSDNTGILDLFTLTPENQRKCPSDTPVRWDTRYYLEYSGEFVAAYHPDSEGNSGLYLTPKKSAALLWKLQPKDFEVYYCDSGICSTVNVERVKFNGDKARYRGNTVYRDTDCMLQCDTAANLTVSENSGKDCQGSWWWVVVVILFSVTVSLIPVLWVKGRSNL